MTTYGDGDKPGWLYELGLPLDWRVETRMPGGNVQPIRLDAKGQWLTEQQLVYKRDLPQIDQPVIFRFSFPEGGQEGPGSRFLAVEVVPTGVTSAPGIRLLFQPGTISLNTRKGQRSMKLDGFSDVNELEAVLSPTGELVIRFDGEEVMRNQTEFVSHFLTSQTLQLRTGQREPFFNVQVHPVAADTSSKWEEGLRLWAGDRLFSNVNLKKGRDGSRTLCFPERALN